MAPALFNSHRTSVAFHFEVTPGLVPVDAAAWATSAAGATGFRLFAEELDVAFMLGEIAVPNVDMQPEVYAVSQPHKGLPTADGGALLTRLWGSEESWAAATLVTESGQGRLLKHALGGGALGEHTDISVFTSPTVFELTSVAGIAVGHIIGIEDADDLGRVWPVQVLAVAANEITIDRELPFVPAVADKIIGAEMAWPDPDAITNPQDPDSSTLSILVQKGPDVWVAGGSHLELAELAIERGQQPKLNFSILSAHAYPQGAGAPSAPTWTDTIEGLTADTRAIGRDTKCWIQTKGDSAFVGVCLFDASITPGVTVEAQDGVTECDDGSPGRVGYYAPPADTVVELTLAMADTQQDRWTAGTELTVSYYQVAATGQGWVFHMAKAFVMDAPAPVTENSNRWTVKLQATHDIGETDEALAAKFILARL